MILYAKFGQRLPSNRQSEVCARIGLEVSKAINYMLKRWPAFTLYPLPRFLDDGRILPQ
jgi:hypothetical protein